MFKKKREKDYKYLRCKQQIKLYYSLKKYSWKSHKFEIIEECLEFELDEKEAFHKQQFIDEFGWSKALFCQIRDGKGGRKSEETRKKISKANKGRQHSPEIRKTMGLKKGFKYSEESRQAMSKALKGKSKPKGFGEKISKANKGRIKNEETLKQMRESNPNKKSVLQIDPITNKIISEFNSMKEAGRILGINANGITEVISGRQKTSFGYIWKLK